jgi:H+/gluconate symporter-like permease
MLDLSVLILSLSLLILLILRGKPIEVAAPLCALILALGSRADILTAMTGHFVSGFAEYLADFFFIFLLGGSFGKLMEDSLGAKSLASAVTGAMGRERALLAVILCCALLTYGGVSLFVVGFAVYPLAVLLFQAAKLPRRFIPGAMAFGSVTFTMTSAGSPEIQNLIPIRLINEAIKSAGLDLRPTDAMAGWPASLAVALALFFMGWLYLEWHRSEERRVGERV